MPLPPLVGVVVVVVVECFPPGGKVGDCDDQSFELSSALGGDATAPLEP